MTRETLATFLSERLDQVIAPRQSVTGWCEERGLSQAFWSKWVRGWPMPEKYIPVVAKGLKIPKDSADYATFVRLVDDARLRSKASIGGLVQRLEVEAAEREAQLDIQRQEIAALRALAGQMLRAATDAGIKMPKEAVQAAKALGLG